jgi:hypothetical protein
VSIDIRIAAARFFGQFWSPTCARFSVPSGFAKTPALSELNFAIDFLHHDHLPPLPFTRFFTGNLFRVAYCEALVLDDLD